MSLRDVKVRQVVDWGAAIWAALISGLLFLVISIIVPWITLGDPWVHVRLIASLALGPTVIPPQDGMDLQIPLIALAIHMSLSIVFACIVAFVIHRWGWVISALGGALLGLALYAINFYTLSILFAWVFPLRNWMLLCAHVLFGATVGLIYELLEVERYEPLRPAMDEGPVDRPPLQELQDHN